VLRTMIISPVAEQVQSLEEAIEAIDRDVTVCRTAGFYPPPVDVVRMLRAHAPEVVFLSFEDIEQAHEIVSTLETEVSGIQIIAIHHQCDVGILRETMRAGIREFLAEPFELSQLLDSIQNVQTLLERKPLVRHIAEHIFSFLPSKAGVGTSTIALNISAALARIEGARVMLSDFDLNSGMLRFLLKLGTEHSVMEALEYAHNLDENMWQGLVTKVAGMDVLHAGRVNPSVRIESDQLRHLINFWRRNYTVSCIDLSGNLERYSLDIMRESRQVMVVCTPEVASLHLTREKIAFLKSMDLEGRVSIILNRVPKDPVLSLEQVEQVLGMKVLRSFSNDYLAVSKATAAAECVDPKSKLGRQYSQFANELLNRVQEPLPDRRRKLLDLFTPAPISTALAVRE